MEQDPRFALRIMVDIANKALSPAINDPTTAVLALDQIHRMLMYIGQRHLDAGQAYDAQGRLRLCYGTPVWGDFVSLAVTEIRHFGANSIQVAPPAPSPARASAACLARTAKGAAGARTRLAPEGNATCFSRRRRSRPGGGGRFAGHRQFGVVVCLPETGSWVILPGTQE